MLVNLIKQLLFNIMVNNLIILTSLLLKWIKLVKLQNNYEITINIIISLM